MTGYGDARAQEDILSVTVETRSINNRYLKINTRCPDAFAAHEGEIEKVIRGKIRRGTVSVSVRVEFNGGQSPYRVDETVLADYIRQLRDVGDSLGMTAPNTLGDFLELPGVLREDDSHSETLESAWDLVRQTLSESIDRLLEFRATEGRSMRSDLDQQCSIIQSQLDHVKDQAPKVVQEFRERTLGRVQELLADSDIKLDASDVIREVSVFADRCDINEEITRLMSHLDQFASFLDHKESQGRKLEFLVQEMFREVNTIGSKANNVKIAHSVVEMKAAIEKMREILQNAE